MRKFHRATSVHLQLTCTTRQFGNCLVLAATYNSDLSHLVDGKQLKTLLDRTIRFLKLSEAISPTLERDAKLLEHIRATLFPNHGFSASTSFSSA